MFIYMRPVGRQLKPEWTALARLSKALGAVAATGVETAEHVARAHAACSEPIRGFVERPNCAIPSRSSNDTSAPGGPSRSAE